MEQDELSFNRVPRCGKSPLKRKPAITNNEIAKKMRFKVQFRKETKTNKQSLRNRKRKPKTVYNWAQKKGRKTKNKKNSSLNQRYGFSSVLRREYLNTISFSHCFFWQKKLLRTNIFSSYCGLGWVNQFLENKLFFISLFDFLPNRMMAAPGGKKR